MRTESAKVLMRTESADWRTRIFKNADWCNPDQEVLELKNSSRTTCSVY